MQSRLPLVVLFLENCIDNHRIRSCCRCESISGTSVDKRKGFQEMIEDAKAGKIDLILTKSISRFGRNIVDILTTLRELTIINISS